MPLLRIKDCYFHPVWVTDTQTSAILRWQSWIS